MPLSLLPTLINSFEVGTSAENAKLVLFSSISVKSLDAVGFETTLALCLYE